MGNELSDTNSANAFSVPAVDKSNQHYLQLVKDFNDRAVGCRQEKDFECAIDDFSRAIDVMPDFAKAHNNRGEAYSAKGETDLAVKDFTNAIKI
jgi:tetratricopeptide (TPR) repeat protein